MVYKNPNYLKCKKPRFAIILLNKIKGYLYFNDEKSYKWFLISRLWGYGHSDHCDCNPKDETILREL